ncbi:hypothetical protein NDU88_001299 [Pleurodeles waltl]|uniref:Uncharacterized protein n=1 Tax=Pleurodeles waltl TaxID=8319 RepID=A0AAV7S765_PLEWA|nr:hypothetical protein NDU88_001299 [Pleurodeles waltl]
MALASGGPGEAQQRGPLPDRRSCWTATFSRYWSVGGSRGLGLSDLLGLWGWVWAGSRCGRVDCGAGGLRGVERAQRHRGEAPVGRFAALFVEARNGRWAIFGDRGRLALRCMVLRPRLLMKILAS